MNSDVQSEGSPTAVTEVTVRDVICGAGLCSMQRSVLKCGVTGTGHTVCVSILSCIYRTEL